MLCNSLIGKGICKRKDICSQVALVVKNPPANAGDIRDTGPIPGLGRSPSWREWQPTPVFLPGESHGQRSLIGCSPWGREESDTTEWLHFCFSLSCIGQGNGNPLQCSCLENPRDGGAWWAAIYGVTQSWTRLKWLNNNNIVPNDERLNVFLLKLEMR